MPFIYPELIRFNKKINSHLINVPRYCGTRVTFFNEILHNVHPKKHYSASKKKTIYGAINYNKRNIS